MKILNQTYRSVESTESSFVTTKVSELSPTPELKPESLIHIVQYSEGTSNPAKYESMKMRVQDFEAKVYEAVQNTFKTAYWDTHLDPGEDADKIHNFEENCPEGASFKELVEYLKNDAPDEVEEDAVDGFVKHVFYDFDVIKRYMVKRDEEFRVDIEGINDYLELLDCYFAEKMTFTTTDKNHDISHISVNHNKTENDNYCQMKIDVGNKISNEWIVPASGNLVVYGWLDSTSALNNKAIPSSYCVIEARINGDWEIIGAQPVIPAKAFTYVGFNLLVKENLTIRARTGFVVGPKSGQYSNENDGNDTLANNTPNGFKCMVYSHAEATESSESELASSDSDLSLDSHLAGY